MAGESDLNILISAMSAELMPGIFVFATAPERSAFDGANPRMLFEESEGWTAILPRDAAERMLLRYDFPCRMITLNIHSALEAVGFLARITAHLARLDMGVNPVSAFYHDHLFVPEDRAEAALAALEAMSAEAATSS